MRNGSGIATRMSWLGRRWFFGAVALLALNDHVFKGIWPGWVTGKLSDFAGLVVVATLVSVIVGPRWGTVLAGLGFVALKTVPGVAETVAPVLGGTTLRDASDLVALVVLAPLGCVLAAPPPERERSRRGWVVVGLVAGVLATTATSSNQALDVVLESRAGAIYANIEPGAGFPRRSLVTTDGGRTWVGIPDSALPADLEWDLYSRQHDHVCGPDGTCYQTTAETSGPGVVVERHAPGARWQWDGALPHSASQIAIDTAFPERAVATGDDRTVYYRRSTGDWVGVALGEIAGPPQWQLDAVTGLGAFGVPTVLTFVLGLALILRLVPWAPVKTALVILNALACGTLFVVTLLGYPFLRVQFHATWLAVLLALTVLMRGTWWYEQWSLARADRRGDAHD